MVRPDAPGSPLSREITYRKEANGELVSCPSFPGMWVSTGFTAGDVFAPRATRLAVTTLAALAGSDFLQFADAYAEQKAE